MQELYEYIREIRGRGIDIFVSDNKLKYRSSEEELPQDIKEYLTKNKDDIITFILNSDINNLLGTDKIKASQELKSFDMTDIQLAYFIGSKNIYKYGDVSCHIYIEIEYEKLDYLKTKNIWNKLIQENSMLSARVNQDFKIEIDSRIDEYILKYYKIKNNELELENIRSLYYEKEYNTESTPLFDIGIIEIENEKDILFLSINMLIADWRSVWVLIEQFEQSYFKNKEINRPKITFGEYIQSYNKIKESLSYYEDRYYWMNKAQNIFEYPKLDTELAIGNEYAYKFNHYSFLLSNDRWQKIVSLSRKYKITPTVVVLSIYSISLRKFSLNKDFTLNLTTLNRPISKIKLDDVVGDFTETTLLQCFDSNDETYLEYFKKMQNELMESLMHRNFSGVEVLREISKERNKPITIMPYVFTSAIGLLDDIKYDIVGKLDSNNIRTQTPQVFIDCQAMDSKDGLVINLDVRNGIHSKSLIKDIITEFKSKLDIISDSSSWDNLMIQDMALNKNDKKVFHGNSKKVNLMEEKLAGIHSNYDDGEILNMIKKIIEEACGIRQFSMNDNLYSLGADSLVLAKVSTKVRDFLKEHKKSTNVGFDEIFRKIINNPTAKNIYNILKDYNSTSDSVLLSKNDYTKPEEDVSDNIGEINYIFSTGSNNAQILLHAGFGTLNCYRYIIEYLKDKGKVDLLGITISDTKKYCSIAEESLIENLALEYAEKIIKLGYKKVQIIGYCISGLIAVEVARYLKMHAYSPEISVTLIDSYPINYRIDDEIVIEQLFLPSIGINFAELHGINSSNSQFNKYIYHAYMYFDGYIPYKFYEKKFIDNAGYDSLYKDINYLAQMTQKDRFEMYTNCANKKLSIQQSLEMNLTLYKAFLHSFRGANYVPHQYVGDLFFLKAKDYSGFIPDEENSNIEFWNRVCLGKLNVIDIDGNHVTCTENPENAKNLSEVLLNIMEGKI